MSLEDLGKLTAELKDKYPDLGVQKVEMSEDGKASLYIRPTDEKLAFIEDAAVIRRDYVTRDILDLLLESKLPSKDSPQSLFKRSYDLYWDADIYGTVINTLSNFAMKGFENDIGDPDIKNFYDSWAIDVNFEQILEWIYLDLFRTGMVRTYKVLGKYQPRVSHISPVPGQKPKKVRGTIKEIAARKLRFSKSYIPLRYTVLNPQLVTIEGSLLFNQQKVTLKPTPELKKLLQAQAKDLTPQDKEIIRLLPAEFKRAVNEGKNIELNPELVGSVDYRKMPYERYPKPRGVRAFDSFEYKKSLREADISTLDGISNYILKITIGNDNFPVTDAAELKRVADLFNTPSKSFDVVWNHTLDIEKIVSPEIGDILGQDKYGQVNEDITGALAFPRMLIDGLGSLNVNSAKLVAQSVIEEIHYARRQVTRWIYNEYRQIAEAMGFDRYPKVRWDQTILKDEILYMTIISQLVDRRMLSYRTALEKLGFDFENEYENMSQEFDDVLDGIFGIIGSPWQQAKAGLPVSSDGGDGNNIQPTQRAPQGTPSGGRPRAQPGKPKQQNTNPDAAQQTKAQENVTLKDVLMNLDDETFDLVMDKLKDERDKIKDGE